MFNDQFAVFFMSYAIYLIVVDRKAVQSSVLIGMALSIKAPIVLLLPAYLGTI